MLSFLRSRSPRSQPQRSPLRDWQWSGNMLALDFEPAFAGEFVALDLDGTFFADTKVADDGSARFAFAFPPSARTAASLMPRRGRDGEALVPTPLAIRFGQAGAAIVTNAGAPEANRFDPIGRRVPFGIDCAEREVAIVVPVYDAPSLVERCLDSVLEHTTGPARLIVIDDASPNPAVAPLLSRYASLRNVSVLRNETNRGFTATANRGIAEAGRADVVLLNADTEVGPNWLTGLRRAAACATDVATVTAVSDNAGAFSVPELENETAFPEVWTFAQASRALWHDVGTAYPELPTGNGFCMYIRRAVVDAVGALDEAAFPHGYGEENDFCQRASAHGLRHLIAGNVYVRHARSASFGHERRATLGEAGMAVLRERWPNYEADVAATLHSFERRVLDWRVRCIFAAANEVSPRLRVLYAGDVSDASADHDVWQLRVDGDDVDLWHDGSVAVSHAPHCGGEDADPTSLDEHLWYWLQAYAIEAIIVRERFPPSLPRLAQALDIPFVNASRAPDDPLTAAIASTRSFAENRP
jgi:GT2 family glycosyltransferase